MRLNPIFFPAIVVCLTVVLLRAWLPVAAWQQPNEPNEPAEQFKLAQRYFKGEGLSKDYAQAVKWLRKAAEQGFAIAQTDLGAMYANGQGVSKDYAEATCDVR